ncbi:MAG TPA: hypothetical protein VFG68_22600 [Fimbriiglobus sp.]|nr:hypothetical protein [Fimbriiglobus sp.]
MPIDTTYGFDSSDPQDRVWIDKIHTYKHGRALGVPAELIRYVRTKKVGQVFVIPAALAMVAGQSYSAAQLAALLGADWTPKRVRNALNHLGKPEKRHKARIFTRPIPGQYAVTQPVKDAIQIQAPPIPA